MPKRSTLRLTIRSVAALPATGRDAFYWDHDLAGFGVRVQRNGRKAYVVQSRGPAGLKRVTLGPVAGEALDKRRREAAAVIDRIKSGLEPIPPKPEPDPTVADLAARCMGTYVKVHCKPNTERHYRTAIDQHIVPALGAMPVKDVRPKHVIELHDRLRDTPSMANHVVAMLSKMFSLAATWDLVPRGRNPCKRVRHYREEPRERFLTQDEYRSVGAALAAGDAVGLRQDGDRWLLVDRDGVAIGRLARKFEPPDGAAFVEGSVYAIITRYRSDSGEDFRSQLRRDRWSVVLPELVYRALNCERRLRRDAL